MLEAYKKYILVSLILHGKVQPLPKYTSQIVGRFIKVRTGGMSTRVLVCGAPGCWRVVQQMNDDLSATLPLGGGHSFLSLSSKL